jgi:hypothetical protein
LGKYRKKQSYFLKTAMALVTRTIAAELQAVSMFFGFRNALSVFYGRRYRIEFQV